MSRVSSYQELMAEQARAAVRVTDAHHSSWNRRVQPLPAQVDDRRAIARWDGTLQYDERRVTAPLREMFDNAGREQSRAVLGRYRAALKDVFHENIHLLAAAGTSHGMGHDAYQEEAVEVLDEAVTEAHSYNDLNAYIDVLGLEEIAPGISSVQYGQSYPQYMPAVETFANAVGRRSGLDGAEVIRRLAVVNAEDKFRVAAELIYTSSELPGLVPESERPAAVQQIAAAMKPPFAQIRDYDAADPADLKMAALAGVAANQRGYQEVRTLAEHWSSRQDLHKTLELGLGGTTPIQSPERLGTDQFGTRRQSTQSSQSVRPQSPERGTD
ncbi:MAG: hypothetical protein QOH50_3129 [Kribbellaceae bacterium]|jgi:hypothetical protein|nr:hypothetical protein [Kribbellaceae bacterium]